MAAALLALLLASAGAQEDPEQDWNALLTTQQQVNIPSGEDLPQDLPEEGEVSKATSDQHVLKTNWWAIYEMLFIELV